MTTCWYVYVFAGEQQWNNCSSRWPGCADHWKCTGPSAAAAAAATSINLKLKQNGLITLFTDWQAEIGKHQTEHKKFIQIFHKYPKLMSQISLGIPEPRVSSSWFYLQCKTTQRYLFLVGLEIRKRSLLANSKHIHFWLFHWCVRSLKMHCLYSGLKWKRHDVFQGHVD